MAREDISELLKAGIQAAKDKNKTEARRLLEQVLEIDDSSEPAWMWLASVVDTPRERRLCLENVLEINPNNQRAKEALSALGPAPAGPRIASDLPRPGTQPRPAGQARSNAAQPAPAGGGRRRGLNPLIFIGGGLLAVVLIVLGILLGTNQIGAPGPTPTLFPSVAAQTAVVAQNVTPATLPPNGIIVTSNATELPTFTPTYTNTPNPSATPPPPLPPLTNYHIAFTDAKNAAWSVLGDGSKKTQLFSSITSPIAAMSFAKSGKVTYVGLDDNKQAQIFVADADGQNNTEVTRLGGGEFVSSPSFSQDGTKIAFVVAAHADKEDPATREIWTINVDGSGQTQVTNNKFEDRDPAWSPDGKQLAYASDPSGRKNLQIFVSAADGTNPTQLTTSTGDNYSPSWSPDGKQIAYVSTQDRYENIYIMDIANPVDSSILTYDGNGSSNRTPSWSQDGVFVVFTSNRDGGAYLLYLMTPNAKFTQKIAGQDDKTDSLNPSFLPGQ